MPFFKKKKSKVPAADPSKQLPPDMVYSLEPRHGHAQDVFDENNVRQVAGCLPIDPIHKRFLLVTSSSNPGTWVIVSKNKIKIFNFDINSDTAKGWLGKR